MRICLVYDCLFPYTVGGAERWYRNLAQRLAADGHEVTYLTLRQWDARRARRGARRARRRGRPADGALPRGRPAPRSCRRSCSAPACSGTCCATAAATTSSTRRRSRTSRCSPPRVARAAAPLPPRGRLARAVDARVLARVPRRVGGPVGLGGSSALCLRVPPAGVLLRQADRGAPARRAGCAATSRCSEGEYAGALTPAAAAARRAARRVRRPPHPGEARAGGRAGGRGRAPDAAGAARPDPRRRAGARRGARGDRASTGSTDVVEAPGFVAAEVVETDLARALCMVLPVAPRGLRPGGRRGGGGGDAERRRARPRTTPRPSWSRRA